MNQLVVHLVHSVMEESVEYQLLELIQENKHAVAKGNTPQIREAKKRAWQVVAEKLNDVTNSDKYSIETLQKKWSNA